MAEQQQQLTHLNKSIQKLQDSLLDGIHSEAQLFAAGSLLYRSDYEGVIIERSTEKLCGYPLCPNSLPLPPERDRERKYRISLSEHRVYDLRETYKFCSSNCLVESGAFEGSLRVERGGSLSSAKVDEVLKLFEELGLEEEKKKRKEEGLGEKGDLGFSNLKINENVDVNNGEVKIEDWIGPSDAIDGYVPQSDPTRKPYRFKSRIEGSKNGSVRPKKGKEELANKSNTDVFIGQKTNHASSKSSLKSLGAKNLTRSVTWADQSKTSNVSNDHLFEVLESGDGSGKSNAEDDDNSLRLTSAKACADAMTRAAEAIASGEADITDAISEAGIVILAQPQDADEMDSDEMDSDEDEDVLGLLKWPKKPEVFDSEPEHPWYECRPEGFSLTLSSFGTMWKSIFGWITSSSLAYIYGRDENSCEEFSLVEGREYLHKVYLIGGRSSEIKQTLAACLSRVVFELIKDLKLPIPLTALERGMVLDEGQVSVEEYELLKDLILPLGRVSDFSAQKGG
ncbi:hypothetical protein GIB67_011319 [Kingdonia uniflora]|uniref:RNA polymerase II subunit B1 CTD phosphatase RPAP2 homolog n=1 Tax=Kingdonia uniflora TaxID=39325 RepID=A0A7J7MP87_9MAGN|nr:hypothetical protein GIB67_011319 [Kingdonia uniflora]